MKPFQTLLSLMAATPGKLAAGLMPVILPSEIPDADPKETDSL